MKRRMVLRRAAKFVSHWEGFLPHAYLDTIAVPNVYTIGFGHTGDVKAGDTITKKAALKLLARDLRDSYDTVDSLVTRSLSVPEKAALCSFTFNCGPGALAESTLLRRVNAHSSPDLIRDAFLMWVFAGGVKVPGLVNRRMAEAHLYVHGKDPK